MTMSTVEAAPVPKVHEMAVMGKEGDTKITWSHDNEHEVENARRSFDYFREQGFTAFRADGPDGGVGETMHEFDPNAEQVVFIPPMQAG